MTFKLYRIAIIINIIFNLIFWKAFIKLFQSNYCFISECYFSSHINIVTWELSNLLVKALYLHTCVTHIDIVLYSLYWSEFSCRFHGNPDCVLKEIRHLKQWQVTLKVISFAHIGYMPQFAYFESFKICPLIIIYYSYTII